jgi:hypothetical protein
MVTDNGEVASIGAPKIETLLAVLLVRADRIVATSQLMAEIWEDRVPRRAMAGLHVYVSQLRKFLSRCGHTDSPIITQPPGYELRSGADESGHPFPWLYIHVAYCCFEQHVIHAYRSLRMAPNRPPARPPRAPRAAPAKAIRVVAAFSRRRPQGGQGSPTPAV